MLIYLASAENKAGFEEVLEPIKAPHILMSYFYLRNKSPKILKDFMERAKKFSKYIFLDSWAHTFLAANDLKGENFSWPKITKKLQDPHDYFRAYKEFLKEHWHWFDAIAELDIWGVPWVTYNDIRRRRIELCKIGLRDKLVVVWHHKYFSRIFWDRREERERMLDSYKYLAIGDDPPKEILDIYFSLRAKKGNYNRIHWFAETKPDKIKGYPYWSVDSTSWQIGSRFWQLLIHDKKNVKMRVFWWLDRTPAGAKITYDKFVKEYQNFEKEAKKLYTIDDMWQYSKWAYARDTQNAFAFMALERQVTSLWNIRWVDFIANPPTVSSKPTT